MEFSIEQIRNVVFHGGNVTVSNETMTNIEECFEFLKKFASKKIIYGINTGFGPMAQWRVEDAHLKELQYNIIRSHSTGVGDPLPDECVLAAMIARIGVFAQAKSGIHREVV
ncbi:MAG: aromatic amino acid lyase, partial [Paludibacteraceae bacterium]|nr:aromatic amino acid lyase [Paludibacteraceae bacterium]